MVACTNELAQLISNSGKRSWRKWHAPVRYFGADAIDNEVYAMYRERV
jgi:hypothetical protein